jgi:tRNA(adenine34) deaminase
VSAGAVAGACAGRRSAFSAPAARARRVTVESDAGWMAEALRHAVAAGEAGEVPVGAAVVLDGRLLAAAGNASIGERDPTAHAEVLALRAAARMVQSYRLPGAILYATVEPCPMCIGAALHARVARLVFGCTDPKGGAAGTLVDLAAHPGLNHRIAVTGGVAEAECRTLVQTFFRARRRPS